MVLRVNCGKSEQSAIEFMSKSDAERASAFSVNPDYIWKAVAGTVERTIFIKELK